MLVLSVGTLVWKENSLLLCHVSRSSRWDIPKGIQEAGESLEQTAVRELYEETGIRAVCSELVDIGCFSYLRTKQLHLFHYAPSVLLDEVSFVCASFFSYQGVVYPECDQFRFIQYEECSRYVTKRMNNVLTQIDPPGYSSTL